MAPARARESAAPARDRQPIRHQHDHVDGENASSIPQVVGTCAMGPSPERGSFVDAMGRVHGVAGLAVVDASIMPEPPSGFPHIITIMLAEHLSEKLALASSWDGR